MCSLAAAVQGMDETVNNGAQAIYFAEDVSPLSISISVLMCADEYYLATQHYFEEYPRSRCWCPIPGMCNYRLLAHRALESTLRPTRYYLHFLRDCCCCLCMGRRRKQLGQSVHCSFRSWFRHWLKIKHRTRVCCRYGPEALPVALQAYNC